MNKRLAKYLKRTVIVLVSLYVIACILLYFFQEKILLHPEKIADHVTYDYQTSFKEENYSVADNVQLNTLFFDANDTNNREQLIFYIHGNAENLQTAGHFTPTFTNRGFDCFLYDFRGFGKSDGSVTSEAELFADAQVLYDQMKKKYEEKDIIIVGYSIGTGIAAWLAAHNHPRKLILQAPYFSMKDMMRSKYPIFPTFLLKYPLETNERLKETNCPVYILHGDKDESIPYSSSKRLRKVNPKIDLTILKGLGHSGFMENERYQEKLDEIFGE